MEGVRTPPCLYLSRLHPLCPCSLPATMPWKGRVAWLTWRAWVAICRSIHEEEEEEGGERGERSSPCY